MMTNYFNCVQLYIVYSVYAALVLIMSCVALSDVLNFTENVSNIVLPQSPKALNDLQNVFSPPMKSMQLLVFFFDLTVMLYYIFQWPVWDSAKQKFPFFSADLKTIEKADCSNFVLMLIFIILSKVSVRVGLLTTAGYREWHSLFALLR